MVSSAIIAVSYCFTTIAHYMIPVTRTYLPPLEEYTHYLQGIWESSQVSNFGSLNQELEAKLMNFLQVSNLAYVSSGTIGLQLSIKALGLGGRVITTPFSYVATTSSLVWEGCHPVFVDINPQTLTIDPQKIEEAITDDTSAILATHIFGIPNDIESISEIASANNIKVIYDAAHAFGVNYKGKSLVGYGDISVLSFHATKLFHTVEGGGVVCRNPDIAEKIDYMRNFGHSGEESFSGLGINGKNSELHAAMGLSVLPKVAEIIVGRKQVSKLYDEQLSNLTCIVKPVIPEYVEYNYSHYPVLFPDERVLLRVKQALNEKEIFPRRYFYPSLSTLPYVEAYDVPIARSASERVLCLPLHHQLAADEVEAVCRIIKNTLAGVKI